MNKSKDEYLNLNINNLDFLIKFIYDTIYLKNIPYNIKFIDVTNINLERFKLYDYNLDTIFNSSYNFINEYETGLKAENLDWKQFVFKRSGKTESSYIRIVEYPELSEIPRYSISHPINVNLIIRTLLSELVVNYRTNNILLPIINVDVVGSDLIEFKNLEFMADSKKYYSIQITEKFYKMSTLEEFLKTNPITDFVLENIIHQAADVLYNISIVYSNFRSNQMFPEMIDCYSKTISGNIYPEIKIGNFYLSRIHNIIENDYLKIINIPEIDSIYSDFYCLINWMWNNLNSDFIKYTDLVDILDKILPPKIRSTNRYLDKIIWDRLTDEEKFSLEIKNIKNIIDDHLKTKYQTKINSIDIPEESQIIQTEEILDMPTKDNNKKYGENIDNMSDDSIESTEDRKVYTRKPRLITIPEKPVQSRIRDTKLKTYHGTRIINNFQPEEREYINKNETKKAASVSELFGVQNNNNQQYQQIAQQLATTQPYTSPPVNPQMMPSFMPNTMQYPQMANPMMMQNNVQNPQPDNTDMNNMYRYMAAMQMNPYDANQNVPSQMPVQPNYNMQGGKNPFFFR